MTPELKYTQIFDTKKRPGHHEWTSQKMLLFAFVVRTFPTDLRDIKKEHTHKDQPCKITIEENHTGEKR